MTRILLVEDNEMNRDLISRKLKRQGFEVLLAVDGAEGIEKVGELHPDLVLMDMGLPVLDGYAATRLLKGNEQTRSVPVIGLSAHAMTGDAEKAISAGCDDYETKPVEWDRLLPKIRGALERAASMTAVSVDPNQDMVSTQIQPSEVAGARPSRVLVVDDSVMNRGLICRRLGELGYLFEQAENASRAWDLLSEKPFDAVLLDVSLAGATPQEMLARIRGDARQGNIPVLMISPIDSVDDAIGCLKAGADDYIPQPYHAEVLAARLGAALERRDLREKRKTYDNVVSGEERHSEHLLRVLFPGPIVEELKATQKILPRRHSDVALLFCDVVGFKALCDVNDPLEVLSHLQSVIGAFEEVAERHQVIKVKTIGDSLMLAGGLFPPVPNPVLDCVRCALDLKEAANKVRPNWSLRIGIHVGPVVAGVVGRKRYQFDLWGATVQMAARVKAFSPVDAVTVSEPAWRRLAGSYDGQLLEGAVGKKGETMPLYRIGEATA